MDKTYADTVRLLLAVERRPLSARTGDLFGVEFDLPVLAPDELYASKLVAALDRQHPRDLFDVWQLFESGDISDGMVECLVIYLAGHNRPPHEVLFGNDKDIAGEYERAFVGMTEVDCSLETLLDARARLRRELPQRLSTAQKQFLSGLAHAEPDWSLVQCQHAAQLPALRWKLANLETFRKRRPYDFNGLNGQRHDVGRDVRRVLSRLDHLGLQLLHVLRLDDPQAVVQKELPRLRTAEFSRPQQESNPELGLLSAGVLAQGSQESG